MSELQAGANGLFLSNVLQNVWLQVRNGMVEQRVKSDRMRVDAEIAEGDSTVFAELDSISTVHTRRDSISNAKNFIYVLEIECYDIHNRMLSTSFTVCTTCKHMW